MQIERNHQTEGITVVSADLAHQRLQPQLLASPQAVATVDDLPVENEDGFALAVGAMSATSATKAASSMTGKSSAAGCRG